MCGHYCGLMGDTDSFRDSRGLRESAVSPVVWERRAVLFEPARLHRVGWSVTETGAAPSPSGAMKVC
jgi:hypothetical protein